MNVLRWAVVGVIVGVGATPGSSFAQGQWQLVGDLPDCVEAGQVVYDANRDEIVFFQDGRTWAGRPGAWEMRSEGTEGTDAPADGASAAYHAASMRIVAFGGVIGATSDVLRQTWTWDGASWSLAAVDETAGPPARETHGLIADPSRGVVVLFGGHPPTASRPLSDTWEWDGAAWTERVVPTQPPGRKDFAATWDAASTRIVVHGGWGNSGGDTHSDTWALDGTGWARIALEPKRRYHGVAFHPGMGELLMHGGTGASMTEPHVDTLALRDGTWVDTGTPAPSTDTHWEPVLIWDAADERMLLFGGGPVCATEHAWEYVPGAATADGGTAPDDAGSGGADAGGADAGPVRDGRRDSGCSIASDGAGTPAVWMVLAALFAGARRRR